MGIKVEYNPDLALRNIREYERGNRSEQECIPEHISVGGCYPFLKKGQRNYWLEGEIPLVETDGKGTLSRPLASIQILNAIHFRLKESGEVWTEGKYTVEEVFKRDSSDIHFEGFKRR